MVVTCQIDFDNNPFATYFAGQVVTGKVTLTADKPKKVKGVALQISGYAHTHWSESRTHSTTSRPGTSPNQTTSEFFNGREDYLASLTYLLGSEANQSSVIAPGIHTFNFACHLPVTCPSSFEGGYGHIRYIIKIMLIRPWKYDQTFTKGFTVLKIMDLNLDSPLLRVPAAAEIQKTYCCGPCRSQPMTINVSLAQSGYVPGQQIPITVKISNNSNVPVESISIALRLLICYYSQTPRLSCKNASMPISKIKGEGVPKHTQKSFHYELPIPATPPTCFNLCRLIQIAYEVTVEAKVSGMHSSQIVATPVTIGNVPLMGVIQQQPTASLGFQRMLPDASSVPNGNNNEMVSMTKVTTTTTTPESGANQMMPWANIPPPNYKEALHMPHARINADESHDYGEADFAPRYPVFNISSSNAPQEMTETNEVDGSSLGNNHTNGTWL